MTEVLLEHSAWPNDRGALVLGAVVGEQAMFRFSLQKVQITMSSVWKMD